MDIIELDKAAALKHIVGEVKGVRKTDIARLINLSIAKFYGVERAVVLQGRKEVMLMNEGATGSKNVEDLDFKGIGQTLQYEISLFTMISKMRRVYHSLTKDDYIAYGRKVFETESACYFSIFYKREEITHFRAIVTKREMQRARYDYENDYIPISLDFAATKFLETGAYVKANVVNKKLIRMNIANSVNKLQANGMKKISFNIKIIDYNRNIVIIHSNKQIVKETLEFINERLYSVFGLNITLTKRSS